jgi:hypothetical protein
LKGQLTGNRVLQETLPVRAVWLHFAGWFRRRCARHYSHFIVFANQRVTGVAEILCTLYGGAGHYRPAALHLKTSGKNSRKAGQIVWL